MLICGEKKTPAKNREGIHFSSSIYVSRTPPSPPPPIPAVGIKKMIIPLVYHDLLQLSREEPWKASVEEHLRVTSLWTPESG